MNYKAVVITTSSHRLYAVVLTSQEPQAVLQAAKAEATSFGRKKRAKVEFGV